MTITLHGKQATNRLEGFLKFSNDSFEKYTNFVAQKVKKIMTMNKLMYMICCVLLCTTMVAQSSYQAATDAQKKEIIDKITQVSNTMRTMQCDFTQEKELDRKSVV